MPGAALPVATLAIAALHALVLLGLSAAVSLRRRQCGIGIGDGGDKALARRIRAHANFIEHVPSALLLLALLEACGFDRGWVWGFGATLLLSRILHAMGLSRSAGYSFGRFAGTALTWGLLLAMALAGLGLAARIL